MHIIRILNHVLLWSKNGYPQLHPWGVWWPGWVVRPSCLRASSVGFNSLNGIGEPLAYLKIYLYSLSRRLTHCVLVFEVVNSTLPMIHRFTFFKMYHFCIWCSNLLIWEYLQITWKANFISIFLKLAWNDTQVQKTFRVKSHKLSFTFKGSTEQWHRFD